MDMKAICDFCLQFWTGDENKWLPPMSGFERDMNEMEDSAAAGCHCCAIFLANTDLLRPHAERLGLGNNNRVFVVFNEDHLALCFFHFERASTPLRFVLKSANFLEPKLQAVQHESFTGSATSFAQAKGWLRNCRESHPACRSPKSNYYPTRLLHIDSKSQSLRLRHKDSFPINLQYATLSHCWGQAVVQCLKRDSFATFEQGISFTQLAKTFQEAVTVCQELQLEYIWIDCFCIIQDSPGDWEVEALQMRDVYGNSFLNIAATDSKDSHGGLFRERDIKALQPFKLSVVDLFAHSRQEKDEEAMKKLIKQLEEDPDNPGAIFYLSDIEHCWDRFEQAPLNRRSWVLQERLLSPRVLHFDKDQLVWECDSLTACDRFPGLEGVTGLVPDKKRIRLSIHKLQCMQNSDRPLGQEFHDIWRPTIKSYTAAGLTRQTDRLIALEGIAQRLAQIYGCSYVAGLFTRNMESQLAWKLDRDVRDMKSRVPDVNIAPSWSWASFLGEIDMLPQWYSVDTEQRSRRLEDHELFETVLCEVTNKEQLAASWSPSVNFEQLPLKIRCFMAQVRLVDFSEVRAWPNGKHQMVVWREEDKNGPVYSHDSLPYDEERPLDDLWPLVSRGSGNGNINFGLWQGQPGRQLAVHSLTNTQKDFFCVGVDLDLWEGYRKRRTFHLMPTYEVTRYEPQDIWEKIHVRTIQGLILERLEDDGNRFRRIGVFSLDFSEHKKFWRAAVDTDVPGLRKHKMRVDTWPDLDCEVGSQRSITYTTKDYASQYQIVVV